MGTAERNALVTGAAGGVGRAMCDAFAQAGYRIIATDLPGRDLPQAASDGLPADLQAVAENEEIAVSFSHAVRGMLGPGGLHALVHNAAVQVLGRFADLDSAAWRRSFEVNLLAPATLTRLFLPELMAARGSVVNVGSVHATATKPGFTCYATTKAGLEGFTRALAVDLAGSGVRVNCIAPAAVRTAMLREGFADDPGGLERLEQFHPIGRIAEPAEIARLAVFLAGDGAGFLTGTILRADGGVLSRLHDPA